MGRFDALCASTVRKLQERYPHIRCVLVIPYRTSGLKYASLSYDEILFPEYKSRNYKSLILERNRYMVDNASYAICYVNHNWGGAAKTFSYTQRKKLQIINLAQSKKA